MTPDERQHQRTVLDASLGGGLAGYVKRIRAQHGVSISGDTFTGCICDDVMCSKHLLLAWCDELAASYEAKVQDFGAETARSDDLAAQLRDARAENERLRSQTCPHVEAGELMAIEHLVAELAAERVKVAKIRDWATADYGGAKTPAAVWPGLAALLGLAEGEQGE